MVHKSGACLFVIWQPEVMKIGYARVSTHTQNLDRQIGALNVAGVDRIFREKAYAKTLKVRRQLEKAIDVFGTNDVFIIAEWDRATRSMMDGIVEVETDTDSLAIFGMGGGNAGPLDTRIMIDSDEPDAQIDALVNQVLPTDTWFLALRDAQTVTIGWERQARAA